MSIYTNMTQQDGIEIAKLSNQQTNQRAVKALEKSKQTNDKKTVESFKAKTEI